MIDEKIRCKVEILTNGQIRVTDLEGKPLEKIGPDQLVKILNDKSVRNIELSPISTYLEIGSGAICLNGVCYWIP